jgi:hypothetical protein
VHWRSALAYRDSADFIPGKCANLFEREREDGSVTVHPEVDTRAPSGLDHHVRAGGPSRSCAEAHSQSRRGIHETTPLWFCCDRRNGARCYRCWKRHLRRGFSVIGPRGPVWCMSAGLLARPWKAGVLDTTCRAGTVWWVPAKLSPWAATGRVLGGLCRLGQARLAAGSW